MNLTALLADVYRRMTYTSSPPAGEITRLTSFLNTTHRQLLGIPGLDALRNDTITFASVASQAYYGLPPSVARIEGITDRTTLLRLRPMALADLRVFDPGVVATGAPDSYIPRGLQQVAVQSTAPTGLWAQSTSAGDTQNAFIETVRTGGYRHVGAAVALTGVTRVALSGLVDHVEVTKFYLSSAAVGAVSLYDAAAAGVELARIPIGGTYARYQGVQLYPTPASAITYHVDYVRTIPEMTNGTDEPLLPEDFHWLLVEGALLKEWTKRDDDRRHDAQREYARGVSALKYFLTCQADDLPARSRWWPGRSRFGPDFPATRY
jgi:hypothetical protein